MAIRVYRVGTIACPLSNTPPGSYSNSEETACLSVWHRPIFHETETFQILGH